LGLDRAVLENAMEAELAAAVRSLQNMLDDSE
jgi:hypothetical protein